VRIAEVIGTVTLSRSHPSLLGSRLVIGVPNSLAALQKQGPGRRRRSGDLRHPGRRDGSLIAFSEGASGGPILSREETGRCLRGLHPRSLAGLRG